MDKNALARSLAALLSASLKPGTGQDAQLDTMADDDAKLLSMAKAHAVAPLICEKWCECARINAEVRDELRHFTDQSVCRSYRLLFYTKYIVGLLESERIKVAVLKGVSTAEYYPQPELRKSGDVDLIFFSAGDRARAVQCLKDHGFRESAGPMHVHHVGMEGDEGIEIELHSMMVEPFEDQAANRAMEECLADAGKHVERRSCMGVSLPVLVGAYHGFSLLMHLLQHFLTAGFGVKLLCDWMVFWENPENQDKEVVDEMLRMIRQVKVGQFAAAVTGVCRAYLGMDPGAAEPFLALGGSQVLDREYLERFFMDIIDAEEFGKSEKGRMVAVQEAGLRGYVRTFHHQMQLNFPRAGRCPLLWPFLWIFTLARFLNNNRKLRGTTVSEILKSAGERGRIAKEMHLFE